MSREQSDELFVCSDTPFLTLKPSHGHHFVDNIQAKIDSDDMFALNRRQAIIYSDMSLLTDEYMRPRPRHEMAFWWRHNRPVPPQLTDPVKRYIYL